MNHFTKLAAGLTGLMAIAAAGTMRLRSSASLSFMYQNSATQERNQVGSYHFDTGAAGTFGALANR